MKKYYAKAGQTSEYISKFYTLDRLNKLDWVDFDGFMGHLVDEAIWGKEGFLAEVKKRYPQSIGIIMRIDPDTAYLWHKDIDRWFTINMLLHKNGHSHTVFGEKNSGYTSRICELNYAPGAFYIFNTQYEHEVYNFGEYRYLFTMKINTEDRYEDVLAWAGEHELLDYS